MTRPLGCEKKNIRVQPDNLITIQTFLRVIVLLLLGNFAPQAEGQYYWDLNGSAAGASSGTTATGTWGVSNTWSTSAAGTTTTRSWTSGQQAIFSAGANATGTY